MTDLRNELVRISVSHLERVQDKSGKRWSADEVDRKLQNRMEIAARTVERAAQRHDISLRCAAYVVALEKFGADF